MATKSSKLQAKTHSVTGSWTPTDFRFYQGSRAEVTTLFDTAKTVDEFRKLPPVLVRKNCGYMGTNSVFKEGDELKKALTEPKHNPRNPNPGKRDMASLDGNCDTLVLSGGIHFANKYGTPSNSDGKLFRDYQREFTSSYVSSGRLAGLLQKYLENLVNGAVLWRNQYGFSRKTLITVKTSTSFELFKLAEGDAAGMAALVAHIAPIAAAKKGYFWLDVVVLVELGNDAEVYPSQPFVTDKKSIRTIETGGNYGRILSTRACDTGDQVIFAGHKVGNALRTIDDMYGEGVDAIAVGVYGAVTTIRETNRAGNGLKNSFFDLIQREIADLNDGERDYLMAMFILGGMFGNSSSEA